VDAPCAGNGTCGKCRVQIDDHAAVRPSASDHRHLSAEELGSGWRLACTCSPAGEVRVRIPDESLSQEVVSSFLDAWGPVLGDADAPDLVAACDLGTTTVVCVLIESRTGQCLARASGGNPQTRYGGDVIARLQAAMSDTGQAADLQRLIIGCIERLLLECCDEVGISHERIGRLVIAGNTAMQHLLLKWDVSRLAVLPFEPTCREAICGDGIGYGFALPLPEVYVMPVLSGYVGGDIASGLLAWQADQETGPTLLVDLGTNGEIALLRETGIFATATAAGPAFEGAGISCGMRAEYGAITDIQLRDGRLVVDTIAGAPARGLCGTGLIAAMALCLEFGLCDETGLILDEDEWPEGCPEVLRQAVRDEAVALAPGVVLRQRDIRQLQLAKAAIAAGIEVILARQNIAVAQLQRVIVAGGFGFHLDIDASRRIGLLPAGVANERIEVVGNASLAGARIIALQSECRKRVEQLARSATTIDLSGTADFEEAYIEHMEFPESAVR
jgi:uncharacterized 2Fe-2S/4Fe-4S cluster protein (DUF4445 family)